MSICVKIDSIPLNIRNNINKDLEIKIENKFGGCAPKYIYPFEIEKDNITLPFAYSVEKKIKRPTKDKFKNSLFK